MHDHPPSSASAIDEAALNDLIGRTLVDLGAVSHGGLAVIGDQLGLYKALAAADAPLSSGELAARTGTAERYVREWLRSQAAGGYVTYHADTGRYAMTPEQAMLMAHDDSPAFLAGGFQAAVSALAILPKLLDAFKTGEGVGWHEHTHTLFEGVARFYRTSYLHELTSEWMPALDGVVDRLQAGAQVADVGCGHGITTLLLAEAFPASTFVGYDFHPASVETARAKAQAAGLADRVRFEVADAKTFGGGPYDLVTTFDCFHDLGDPAGVAAHIRQMLKPDGTWMLAEPQAGDRVEDNLNPLGRAFYSDSTLICVPCSLDQEVGLALGAQAGAARIGEIITASGFTRFRKATETPFNLVLEARP